VGDYKTKKTIQKNLITKTENEKKQKKKNKNNPKKYNKNNIFKKKKEYLRGPSLVFGHWFQAIKKQI